METYIGTKCIKAKPMTRLEYNQLRGWELPPNENGSDEGYLVEYLDSPNSNVEGYKGYVSWSPKNVFECAYKPTRQKVTQEHLESIITDKQFHRLTGTLTVCVLTLRNGFVVTGESACADPAIYDQEIGERFAYKNAFDKLWMLEGYVLKNELHLLNQCGG